MTFLEPDQIDELFSVFSARNPAPTTELVSTNTFTLLIAVLLSAQMTDKGVNRATAPLFKIADTPEKMLALGEEGVTNYIRSINYYQAKAKYVIGTCKLLIEKFGGKVPGTREELESLPGVGRKTASVILNVAFGQPTMPVDTHLLRIAPRMGLSSATTPIGVEQDLLRVIPQKWMNHAHHWLVLHGRYTCVARLPLCTTCPVSGICPRNGVGEFA
jgi:endonuclease-3